MTALAMIIGMVPMALGLGEGGEQNAPLGRAVIGGLLFATVATLFFVPVFFSVLHGRRSRSSLNCAEALRPVSRWSRGASNEDRASNRARKKPRIFFRAASPPRRREMVVGSRRCRAARCPGDLPILPRIQARATLQTETAEMAIPTVSVARPRHAAPAEEIVFPASVQAYIDSPVYARTNGYLKRWYVDIGARVKAGQLLAEIDTPEVDQQLQQTRADLATAEANVHLAQITADRYRTAQERFGFQAGCRQRRNDYPAKKTIVQSAQANVSGSKTCNRSRKSTPPLTE